MIQVAYVFPGQGSQRQGMLKELAEEYTIVHDVFHEISDALGYDVWRLIQDDAHQQLNQTEYTQVAMLASDVAVYRVLRQASDLTPLVMAGHSLGEYPALVCANALALADAAKLVQRRGQLMQAHIPSGTGAMAAIVGLEDDEVRAVCEQATQDRECVTAANYNAPGQVVVAGHTPAVHRAIDLAKEKQARLAIVIPVSVPCHCPLLQSAADEFAHDLDRTLFKRPDVPVISNVDVCTYTSPEHIKTRLKEQLYSPVRFVETVQHIVRYPVQSIIECGPGRVLTGLVKRIDKRIRAVAVEDPASMQQALDLIS